MGKKGVWAAGQDAICYGILSTEGFKLVNLRIAIALLFLGVAVSASAQNAPSTGDDSTLNRRIEVAVRNQFSLPPEVDIRIGTRKPSEFKGYETVPITLSQNGRTQAVDFLLSTDGTKLARLNTYDLTKDPAETVSIAGRPVRGNPAAKVTVVSFDDLECPYCARMHEELFPATMDRYKNMVRYVYKDDPLTDIHPWAMHAAVDANCLAAQSSDVYWTYLDYLHGHGQEVSGADHDPAKSFAALDRIAREEATVSKLNEGRLSDCLTKQDESQVQASLRLAQSLDLDGTPAVFVNGERVNGGAVPKEQLWAVIDRALRAAGEEPPAPEAKPAAMTGPPSGAPNGAAGSSK